MKKPIVLIAFVILAGCEPDPVSVLPAPECQAGIEGTDGKCYVVSTDVETVTIEICYCAEDGVATDCEAPACEGEVIRETVCLSNGAVVENEADCPEVSLTCPRGTAPSGNAESGELRCDPEDLTLALDDTSPRSTFVLYDTGTVEVARFRIRNNTATPALLHGVILQNSFELAVDETFNVLVDRAGDVQTACVGTINPELPHDGCFYPLSTVTLDAFETVTMIVELVTPSEPWSEGEVFFAPTLTFFNTEYGLTVSAETAILANTLPYVSLASGSPSGQATLGLTDVLHVNVTADERGDLDIQVPSFLIHTTDNAGSGWAQALMDPSKLQLFDLNDPGTDLDVGNVTWMFEDLGNGVIRANLITNGLLLATLPAGETATLVLRVDATGASDAMNDSIQATLRSLGWGDGRFGSSIDCNTQGNTIDY